MLKLLKKNDNLVMSNSRFVKNATFYKDCFALYDLFENLQNSDKSLLPNYCLVNGQYCLEGFCLIAKNYASELGFETMKLSLDYLRVLYYSIACFADENGDIDKSLIVSEFNEYKKASVTASENMKESVVMKKDKYEKNKKEYEIASNKYAKNLVLSKVYDVFAVFFLVFAFMSAMVPFSFYFVSKLSLTTAIISASILLVLGVALSFVFKTLDKNADIKSNDIAYSMQQLKKNRDASFVEFSREKDKINKILSEKYEYETNFSLTLSKFVKNLSFNEVLEKASEYNLLSYNFKHDIEKLFVNEEKEVAGLVYDIASLGKVFSNQDFEEIYKKIKSQDWLEYNNEVRFALVKKVIERAEKTNEWQISYNGEMIKPLGFDVKKMAKENIAYLKNENDLFVSSSLDKFLETKYVKNLQQFEIKNKTNNDELKNIKIEYLSHFFNYDDLKDMNNLFYDKKIADGVEIDKSIQERTQKIPSFIELKIKYLENKLKLGNSDSSVINQISDIIFNREEQREEKVVIRSSDIIYPETECETVENIDEYRVRYIDKDNSFIGYKISSFIPATEE